MLPLVTDHVCQTPAEEHYYHNSTEEFDRPLTTGLCLRLQQEACLGGSLARRSRRWLSAVAVNNRGRVSRPHLGPPVFVSTSLYSRFGTIRDRVISRAFFWRGDHTRPAHMSFQTERALAVACPESIQDP